MARASAEIQRLIGRTVREARVQKGLTQAQLSDLAGLTQGYVSELEGGRRNPSVQTLCAIALVVGKTPSELLSEFTIKRLHDILEAP